MEKYICDFMMLFEKDKYPLLEAIKRIIFTGMESYILLIVGATQRGKSMTAYKWSKIWAFDMGLDPTYNIQDRWALADAERFLNIHDQKLKRGAITVLDEGGVGIDNQLWYMQVSRSIVYLTKTYGHEGIFSIITDTTGEINAKVKKHIKGILIIDRKKTTHTEGRFFEVQFNEKENKVYYKFPTMVYNDGSVGKVKKVTIKKPDMATTKEYNDFQKPLKIALKKQLIKEMEWERTNKERKYFDYDEAVRKILEDPNEYTKEYHGGIIWHDPTIRARFNIGKTRSQKIKAMLPDVEETESLPSI